MAPRSVYGEKEALKFGLSTSVGKVKRTLQLRRLLSYLVLFSAAVTFSTILPTPWSFIRHEIASRTFVKFSDAAAEWHDNVWPLRPQTPWDISTDYAYPRKLEYDVQEGTWLRLDVNPSSGDVVFDMIGDIYCLPGAQVSHVKHTNATIKALPVLTGVPYDSDPHFSPSGDRLVFRSDAEHGIENIWVVEWKGCEAMNVRPTETQNEQLRVALLNKVAEEELLDEGIPELPIRRANRLLREGRREARRITNETYRWVSDARFHPSGSSVIANKWYTSSRSLGAGEGWEYSVPTLQELQKGGHSIEAGGGKRLISRSLPSGWTAEKYGDQQIGPEQFVWKGNDSIIYAQNVVDSNYFTYSKDVHSGIYAIFQQNLTTGSTEQLVSSSPGGASRPELSRDGRTLAFVRRVRDKEALVLKDLETGSIHHVWHGLSYDLTTISAPMGTYPSFSFSADDSAVIIWAAGQIYSVPLAINSRGEKVADRETPRPIRFTAHIEKRLAETRRGDFDIVGLETQETQKVRALKALRVDDTGRRVIFQAAGLNYWHDVTHGKTTKVPMTDVETPYYSPTFIHGENDLVLHVRWSDTFLSQFELANIRSGKAYRIAGLPLGRYFSPILCECQGSKRKIAYVKTAGSILSGDILATGKPGLYIADITLPDSRSSITDTIKIKNIQFVPSEIDVDDRVNMRYLETNKVLLVQQSDRVFTIDLSGKTDISGKYPHQTLASGEMSSELAVSPHKPRGTYSARNIAFVDFFHVYLAPGYRVKDGEAVWSRPANATKGLVRLSLDGGHDVTWSRDGRYIFWFLGPYLHHLEVSQLVRCYGEIKRDPNTFGISCVKSLVKFERLDIEHPTDIARLKREALREAKRKNETSAATLANSDTVVVVNATILTMETGQLETDIIRGGIMVVKAGIIKWVGPWTNGFVTPVGATVINAGGGYLIPGFIDAHAHWEGFSDRYPAKSWEMETFLAYGVTTLQNPSADTVSAFVERSRLEDGQMIGPRIFSVGDIIYGAGAPGIHQDIVDMDEAASALTRIRAEGGLAALAYKNYNIPSRASRQRLLAVAQNISMLCVPEGGMNYDWDLTYIIDGMTTVEHNLPIPVLYEDVLTLFAHSGTGSTPTHIVNYGGGWGEQLVWANHDVPNDPKLRRFTRHDILEGLSESITRPPNSFALYNVSASVAAMVDKGLLANIGAHGEPPIGMNYHAEMTFFTVGGLSNYEVLRAATSSGAKTFGLFSSLGSLSRGKLADFLLYPPGVDILEGPLYKTSMQILFVARGGRIWEAETMVELWPVAGRKQEMPVLNAE